MSLIGFTSLLLFCPWHFAGSLSGIEVFLVNSTSQPGKICTSFRYGELFVISSVPPSTPEGDYRANVEPSSTSTRVYINMF